MREVTLQMLLQMLNVVEQKWRSIQDQFSLKRCNNLSVTNVYLLLVLSLLREDFRINLDFRETAHLPLPKANINTYFSLRAKCQLRGGIGRQFPSAPASPSPLTPTRVPKKRLPKNSLVLRGKHITITIYNFLPVQQSASSLTVC